MTASEREAARETRLRQAVAAFRRALVGVPGIEDGRASYEPWQENIRRVLERFGGVQ